MADTPDGWDPLDDFVAHEVTYDGQRKTVYRKGEGPAVVVISEIPGITPAVADFARRVVDLGCTVAMPSLFGDPGRPISNGYAARSLTGACVSKEFATWAAGRTSPVTAWLRHLSRDLHDELGGPGVGVVGMCLTGGFALAMMVDEEVVAPVLSQPSLPFPVGRGRKRDLGISDADLARVKERVDEGVCVLGLRFTGDPVMPADRFARLREELGDGFVGVEIDSSKGNPHGIPTNAHSVLTEHLVDEPGHPTHDALNQVLDLFRERLLSEA
ncbi:MAG: dienelactone hydrolase family protein [Acidimicrobiales bacterium]|nr:dienelactone hydrolase family protein [Acidimicrobiales bacterium]